MSLLYPLMLLGAIAVGVPLWLHLRRRDETDLVTFSAMRFLDDQPVARTRPLWPRDWLLLLLRIAALLLLITAFAWPYAEDEHAVVVEESCVYILDNTLSHQSRGGFERGRDRIADALQEATVRTQLGVIELGTLPRTVVRFGDHPGEAARRVRELLPQDGRGPYLDAFRAAAEMLETSLGEHRRIVFVTDNQANQWQDGLGAQPFLRNVDVDVSEVDTLQDDNLGLSDPAARRFTRDGQDFVECVVRVMRCGTAPAATVIFSANGREVARRDVAFDSAAAPQLDDAVFSADPPANAVDDQEVARASAFRPQVFSVFAEWPVAADEWLFGTARVQPSRERDAESDDADPQASQPSPDALPGDDRVYFSLKPVREGRVALIAGSPYLRQALAPPVMRGRWRTTVLETPDSTVFDSEEPPDVVVLECHSLTDESVRNGVRDTLNAGRGVILLVDRSTPLIVGFLRELGIEMQPQSARAGSNARFRYVFMEHPIFQAFRSPDLGDLSNITVTRHRRLKLDRAMPVAFAANGDPLLFDVQQTTGRMLVFAFNFDRRDTNWPIHPTFIPFLDHCLSYVRAVETTETAYEPGESVVWNVPADASAEQILVRRHDETAKTDADDSQWSSQTQGMLTAPVTNGQARWELPGHPGHYELRYGPEGPLQSVLDVNTAARESELVYTDDPVAIEAWTIPADVTDRTTAAADAPAAVDLSELEILQQHMWWAFLAAAVVAALIETLWVALKPNAVAENRSSAES